MREFMGKVILVLSVFLLSFNSLFAQAADFPRWTFGPSAGWQYQNGNYLKLSGWALFAPNQKQYMKIDAGANLARMQHKTVVIPELGFTYYLSNSILFPFVKAEVTPYTITPKLGLSILSIIDIGLGYGVEMKTKRDFKSIDGLTGSLTLNLPLNFYIR